MVVGAHRDFDAWAGGVSSGNRLFADTLAQRDDVIRDALCSHGHGVGMVAVEALQCNSGFSNLHTANGLHDPSVELAVYLGRVARRLDGLPQTHLARLNTKPSPRKGVADPARARMKEENALVVGGMA